MNFILLTFRRHTWLCCHTQTEGQHGLQHRGIQPLPNNAVVKMAGKFGRGLLPRLKQGLWSLPLHI